MQSSQQFPGMPYARRIRFRVPHCKSTARQLMEAAYWLSKPPVIHDE
jgi:hypothetical protein